MSVIKKDGYLSCDYENSGLKFEVRDGWIYRYDKKTLEISKMQLDELAVEEVDTYKVRFPNINTPTWCFLHDLWYRQKETWEKAHRFQPTKCGTMEG